MKKLSEAIKKINSNDLIKLQPVLEIKKSTENEITSSILSITGLNSVLKTLDYNELTILKRVYADNEGVTISEIGKDTGIDIDKVYLTSINLSQKLLTYKIKNRQHLTNRMDKLYGIIEINNVLNFRDIDEIGEKIKKLYKNLLEKKITNDEKKLKRNKNIYSILNILIQSGGLISLANVENKFDSNSLNQALIELSTKKYLDIIHNFDMKKRTYLILNDNLSTLIVNLINETSGLNLNINNRYNSVINLLSTFDVISTFGLFLTKQGNFRKIDIRRIEDSMLKIKNINNDILDAEKAAGLSLYILNLIGCLKMNRDIAHISLKKIKNEIITPKKMIIKILNCLKEPEQENVLFVSPIGLPDYYMIISAIEILQKLKVSSINYFEKIITTKILSQKFNNNMGKLSIDDYQTETMNLLDFLCYTGIVNVKNNQIQLSDIGTAITCHFLKLTPENNKEEDIKIKKSIYINPDFTLIIPAEELTSLDLYYLLTHSEIVKYDVILHTVISKNSIIKANKRGLPIELFIETLKKHSKNEVPQNLDFLLSDWSKQIIEITVSEAIILKTNHPSFIDEILYNKNTNGIIERISPNYVIIDKDYIDEIVMLAKKKDAVISLFENSEI